MRAYKNTPTFFFFGIVLTINLNILRPPQRTGTLRVYKGTSPFFFLMYHDSLLIYHRWSQCNESLLNFLIASLPAIPLLRRKHGRDVKMQYNTPLQGGVEGMSYCCPSPENGISRSKQETGFFYHLSVSCFE